MVTIGHLKDGTKRKLDLLAEFFAQISRGTEPISFWLYLFALGVTLGVLAGVVNRVLGIAL